MARTGRFGRLPTAAPDLSGQIVSLMEQWMNAEDRNILDAWTNGGKYKGKKVTDARILAHYRNRRNSYDRDDPEWDEWNQDLWQMRFQIADEKVQMNYRMGKIGPAAVARHYRTWARKMPKNSSYYRNLMATAGDFAKTASSAAARAAKGFDYAAMQQRVNKLEAKQKPLLAYIEGLNEYAIARGFIQRGESVMDPESLNAMEAYDLNGILQGYEESLANADHKPALRSAREALGFRGPLTEERLNDAVNEYVRLEKAKIREWRKSPSDYSSYIKGARENIRNVRSWNKATKQAGTFDIGSDLAVAWDIFTGQTSDRVGANDPRRYNSMGAKEEGIAGAIDPADALSGDKNFVGSLRKARNQYARLGESEQVAALNAIIKAFSGDEAAVQELLEMDPNVTTSIFGEFSEFAQPGAIAAFAQERMAIQQSIPLLQSQGAVLRYNEQPSLNEQAVGASSLLPPFTVLTVEENSSGRQVFTDNTTGEKFVMNDSMVIVNRIGSSPDGGQVLNPTLVHGTPIYGPESSDPVGYEFPVREGFSLYGRRNAQGEWRYVGYNPWAQQRGIRLDDRGSEIHIVGDKELLEQSEGLTPMPQDITEVVEAAIDRLEQTEGLTEEEREAKQTGLYEVEDYIADGRWDEIMNDPTLREAYMDAYPEDTSQASMYASLSPEEQVAAQKALVAESARRTHGAEVDYTPEQALFVTPQGALRSLEEVENQITATGGIDNVGERFTGAPQERQDWIDQYRSQPGNENATYREAMAAANAGDLYGTVPYDPNAFVSGAGVDDSYAGGDPMEVLDDTDPNIAAANANGDTAAAANMKVDMAFEAGFANPGVAAWVYDPELQSVSKHNTDVWNGNNLLNVNKNDPAALEGYTREVGAVQTANQYGYPELANIATGNASAAAIESGTYLGIGSGYVDVVNRVTGGLNSAFGLDINEIGLEAIDQPPPDMQQTVPTAASLGMATERRIDNIVPTMPQPKVEEVKPQPVVKMSETFVPQGGEMVKTQKPITYPQGLMPSVQPLKPGAPAPAPSVAPAPAMPSLTPKQWKLEAKAAAAATPPPPPNIEDALKVLNQ